VVPALKNGKPTTVAFRKLCQLVAAPEFELHIDLHLGRGEAILYAADLTEEYVDFNKGDVSDPSSLGG
jgi:N-acetylglutamate synthase/N-acetylornithine aminotransferase